MKMFKTGTIQTYSIYLRTIAHSFHANLFQVPQWDCVCDWWATSLCVWHARPSIHPSYNSRGTKGCQGGSSLHPSLNHAHNFSQRIHISKELSVLCQYIFHHEWSKIFWKSSGFQPFKIYHRRWKVNYGLWVNVVFIFLFKVLWRMKDLFPMALARDTAWGSCWQETRYFSSWWQCYRKYNSNCLISIQGQTLITTLLISQEFRIISMLKWKGLFKKNALPCIHFILYTLCFI